MSQSNNPTLLYNGINVPASIDPRYHFRHHAKSGLNYLIINHIRPSDSGSFECLELTTGAQRVMFQLVVLGSVTLFLYI